MPHSSKKRSQENPDDRTAVLHLAPSMGIHAAAREVLGLCVQTHRAGGRPLLASAGGPLVVDAERASVRHTVIPVGKGGMWGRLRSRPILHALIAREKTILIHAHGFTMIKLAVVLARAEKLPLLIDLSEPAPVTAARRKALAQAVKQGAHFRVPSEMMARLLRNDFDVDPVLIHRILPGVDLDWYQAARVTPERLRKLSHTWRLPEQAPILIMATPFAEGQGHDLLLHAAAALKNIDFYLVLVGQDDPSPKGRKPIEKTISDLDLDGRVVLPDFCPDWPAACWLASLVLATNDAPRGYAPELLAAQALGRLTIVTDCGANTEWVREHETAWVVPTGDQNALENALREALSLTPTRRIEAAQRTRAFVETHFPMTTWRDGIFKLYDDLVKKPAPPLDHAA